MVRGEAPLTLASTSTISVKVQNLLPPLGRQQRVVVVHSVTMEIVVVAGVILRHVSCVPRLVGLKNTSIFFFLTSCCAEGNEDAAACWPPPAIGCCPLDSSSGGPFVEVALGVNS